MRVIAIPAFVQERKAAESRWRNLVGEDPDAEAWDRFDGFMEECAFANILKTVNGDPNYPKVVRLVMPPHEWFDRVDRDRPAFKRYQDYFGVPDEI
jgi:hypothetical protein